MNKFTFCVLKCEKDIIEHEKLLYDAFVKRSLPGWIYNNYKKIDGNRLQAPFSYEDQLIIGLKNEEKLILSLAFNLNINKKMQLEYIGFSRNKIDTSKKIAEGMTFCTVGGNVPVEYFDLFEEFNNNLNNELKKNNIEEIYGTSSEKLKIFYLRIGFEIIDELKGEHEKELLLKKIIN